MPNAAIVATQLTDSSVVRQYGLWIDGNDVISEPGTRRYGVPIDSIRLTVAGPGGVSTFSFVIDDPQKLINVSDGQQVIFEDLTTPTRWFLGWVDKYSISPDFGMQGRTITVDCVGPEALLDWYVTRSDVVISSPAISLARDMVQTVLAASSSAGELRALQSATVQGTQAQTVGSLNGSSNWDGTNVFGFTIPIGTTLREALNMVVANTYPAGWGMRFTVDMYLGLRVFNDPLVFAGGPGDAGDTTTMVSAGAGVSVPADMHYDVDAGAIVRTVIVQGTGVLVTVGDGSGKRGPTVYISDTSITTVPAATNVALVYLAQHTAGTRGSFVLDDDPAERVVPLDVMGRVFLTDAVTGATGIYPVGALDYKFYAPSGTDTGKGLDVTVHFGGVPPSAATLIRSLTRAVRN